MRPFPDDWMLLTAHTAIQGTALGAAARWRDAVVGAWAVRAVRLGTLGSGLVLFGSLTPAFLPEGAAWHRLWLLRSLQDGAGRVVATAILLVGVLLLLSAWLRLYPRDDGVDISRVTLVLWSLPLLLAPPLFSNDAYSYAAQGRVADVGLDPYTVAPEQLGGPFAAQVDPAWLHTPAPYGPLALQMQHLAVDVAGDHAYASAVAMRLPAIAALVVIVILLPRLARTLGMDPRFALWLGVLNPLTVLHLLGGSHNDAMMIALVVVALWLATQRQLVLASLAVALAATVKQPALVAVVAVGILSAPVSLRAAAGGWTRARVGCVAAASALSLAFFAVITAATGLGYGWISAMGVPGQVRNYLSPATALGSLLEIAARLVGYEEGAGRALPATRAAALVLCAIVLVWLAVRKSPRQPVTALVLMFMALVVCAPTVQPWYVMWGGVMLGLTTLGRDWLRSATWLTAFFACYGVIVYAAHNGIVALGVCAGLGVLWMVTGHDRELVRA